MNNEHRIIIGTDRKLFISESPVRERHIGYASQYARLDIIVFARRSLKLESEQLAQNLKLIPTRSLFSVFYVFDAYRQAVACITSSRSQKIVLSTQDPFECGIIGVLLKRRFPHICFEVQLHTDPFSPYFKKHSVLNRVRYLIAPYVYKCADRIRVVLARVKDDLVLQYHIKPEMIRVEPIALDVQQLQHVKDTFDFHERFRGVDIVLISVGRFEKEKNLFFTLKIARALAESGVKLKLVYIGQGSLESQLREQAERELPGRVHFETALSPEEIWTYMRHGILVHTSLYEGYGLVLAEAVACGGRIVTADVGVARELASSYTKLSIADYRIDDFVSKIQTLR